MKSSITLCRLVAVMITVALIKAGAVHSQVPQYTFLGTSLISNTIPFATAASSSNKRQWVYYPSNFPGAPSGYITKIYLKASAVVNPNFTGFLIRMGNTNLTTLSTTFVTNLDTVLYASSISFSSITGNWIPITLQTPWFYDATSNFIVEGSHQGYSPGFSVMQTTLTGRSVFGNSSSATGSLQDRLADFGFDLIPGSTDVGLEAFVGLPDTVCAGSLPVTVSMKNHGPNTMGSATINWTLNNVLQLPFTWSGTLAVNATTNVMIGTALIPQGTVSSIKAWVGNPNGGTDTINSNDTIYKPEIHAVPAPQVSLNDTLLVICQGDTTVISGTLTGSPPWNLVINDGTTNIPVNNIISPIFAIPLTPTLNKTYTITSLSDASGCAATPGVSLQVIVQIAPVATITPVGNTAACQGDSVSLMASIGLNFTYDWYKDGIVITGATSYVLHTKTSGNYSVKVTSPFGCSNLSAPLSVVIHPLPSVFLGNDTNVVPGATVILNAGPGFNSYQWSTGAATQSIAVDTAGYGPGIQTIWVVVRDNNYCLGSDTIKINFVNNPGIEERYSLPSVTIIPNPADDLATICLSGNTTAEVIVKIFSNDGRLIRQVSEFATEGKLMLDVANLPAGQYLLKISSEHFSSTGRLMIQR
jgi:hypothetical protein